MSNVIEHYHRNSEVARKALHTAVQRDCRAADPNLRVRFHLARHQYNTACLYSGWSLNRLQDSLHEHTLMLPEVLNEEARRYQHPKVGNSAAFEMKTLEEDALIEVLTALVEERNANQLADHILGTYLNDIACYRMAARELLEGKFQEAASRMKIDLDKVTHEDRDRIQAFIQSHSTKS